MKNFISLLCIFITINSASAQAPATPKLVVGIVVDQMRPEYVQRYWNKLSNGGFRRLFNEGFNCRNTQFPYMPTHTAPGHASIYTGTTPSMHSITGNNYYDRIENRSVYCTGDSTVRCVGCNTENGSMSPKRMRTTTITDQLEIATQGKAKVVSVSMKDRGSILPAGHAADAAYWYDDLAGNWISSTWYMQQLPQWAIDFNERRWPDQYLSEDWTTLLPIETYTESDPDNSPYEEAFAGEANPVFPHKIPQMPGGYHRLWDIPAGNTYTKDFALAAIQGEQMGRDSITDFLCISFSPTDYIGHQFALNSIEIQDCYMRLDRDLADLLNFLDKNIGKGNYLLFLTSDHGSMENPEFMKSKKIPAGVGNPSAERDSIKAYLTRTYGNSNYYLTTFSDQIHLDRNAILADRRDRCEVSKLLAEYIRMNFPGYHDVITGCQLEQQEFTGLFRSRMQQGYHFNSSGDVLMMQAPGFVNRLYEATGKKGTKHYAPYPYDAHVPLYWYGWNIQKGSNVREVKITDIAPTLSHLLRIPLPNGCTGSPIPELFR